MKQAISYLLIFMMGLLLSCKKDSETPTANNIHMVSIPSGTYLMGSPESEPGRWSGETQHSVTIS
jgi:formylglycine-generating enzyme required for sulfatase activity